MKIMPVPSAQGCVAVVGVIHESHDTPEALTEVYEVLSQMQATSFTRLPPLSNNTAAGTHHEETGTQRSEQKVSDFSRQELDAKLEAIEARMDARVAGISGKIDAFLTGQSERDKAIEKISDERFQRMEKDISSIKSDITAASQDVSGIKITMAKYLGAAIVIGAVASAAIGALIRQLLAS